MSKDYFIKYFNDNIRIHKLIFMESIWSVTLLLFLPCLLTYIKPYICHYLLWHCHLIILFIFHLPSVEYFFEWNPHSIIWVPMLKLHWLSPILSLMCHILSTQTWTWETHITNWRCVSLNSFLSTLMWVNILPFNRRCED